MLLSKKKINEIIKHIKIKANPSALYIFGSYAYGKPHENSDLDLLIIKDDVTNKRKEIVDLKKDIISADYSLDILLYSKKQFEEKIQEGWSLVQEILKHGVKC